MTSSNLITSLHHFFFFFFFNDTATTEIYTLSLHDALPISFAAHHAMSLHVSSIAWQIRGSALARDTSVQQMSEFTERLRDRKSTRLNSSHTVISYAVFCLKKKKKTQAVSSPMNYNREYGSR